MAADRTPADVVSHRFSVLPYMSGDDPRSSGRILVVVCDCGWIDMTDNEVLGMGWDAAVLYRDHMASVTAAAAAPQGERLIGNEAHWPIGKPSTEKDTK